MKKKIALLLGLTLGFTAISCSLPLSRAAAAETEGTTSVVMFRLYNPNSGEHFYTSDGGEKKVLVNAGWRDEGIGWIAPVKSDTPVYRLYNENAGDHHYTIDAKEQNNLVNAGWKSEGIGWYSDDEKSIPLYREYNPNAVTGTHNYTTDKAEHDNLVKAGWKDEGIGWYGIEKTTLKVGDTVILGAYEQDNNSSNGKEEIEWRVLAKEGYKALVISKYALDCQPYNTSYTDVTWETCSLRKWLNGTFISNAFSSDEQNMIQTTTVTADMNPYYDISPGNDTTDKVFLLSIPEAKKYFSSIETRRCQPTDYAKAQGASCNIWWLRSPGNYSTSAAYVDDGGFVEDRGDAVTIGTNIEYIGFSVRPAMWINLGNSIKWKEEQEPIEYYSTLKDASVGDVVKFGVYKQDNNPSTGKEEIKWVVLAKEGDKALVISKYALDCQPYNTSDTDITWETCSLRKWLNGTFISNAFSSDEQNMIQTTTVTADMNPYYDTSPGNDTTDKVFLLSIPEVNKYFSSDEARKCNPTDYVRAKEVWMDSGFNYWWLRSPGDRPDVAALVGADGSVGGGGAFVSNSRYAIRPAMWINLES